MVIWFIMKPIVHLCMKDLESIEINISEPNIMLLNLTSNFKNHLLGIGKSSHHSFNIRMLIISCHEPYSSLSFWLFGEYPFWKNDNKLTNSLLVDSIVTVIPFFPQKKCWRFNFFKNESTMYLLKTLFL